VVLLTAATLLVIVAVVGFTFALRGGGGQGSGTPTGPDSSVVLTVDQALAAEEGQDIKVSGYVVSTAGKVVLASALAESNPPQAGGSTMPLTGLDPSTLVGLSSTAGQAGLADVTWSDYSLVLEGVVVSGVFEVRATPPVELATSGDIMVRFSPVSEPVSSGDQVWWALDVITRGQTPVDLTFSDSQRGDIILDQGDTDLYTWSANKTFTQEVQTVTLQPGKSFPVVLNDTVSVPSGTYNMTARITAMVGPVDTAAPLPEIVTTLVVH
jgi:Intracellular proteinase inhibitor